jgi:hypothetical protein
MERFANVWLKACMLRSIACGSGCELDWGHKESTIPLMAMAVFMFFL